MTDRWRHLIDVSQWFPFLRLNSLPQVHASKGATLGGGGGSGPGSNIALITSLKQSLGQAMQQNSMMRARLQKIHIDSEVGDMPSVS